MAWKREIEGAQLLTTGVTDCTFAYPIYTYGDSWYHTSWDSAKPYNTLAPLIDAPVGERAVIGKSTLPTDYSTRKVIAVIPLVDDNDSVTLYIQFYIYRKSGNTYANVGALVAADPEFTQVYHQYEAGTWTYSGSNVILNVGMVNGATTPYYGLGISAQFVSGINYDQLAQFGPTNLVVDVKYLADQYGVKRWKEIEYSEEFGKQSEEGGYTGGTFDDSSDLIDMPAMPMLGVSSAGFVNIYNPTNGQLQQFGAELFPDLSFTPISAGGSPSSVTDALVAMAQVLVDFGNQIPNIIDMYINSNLINYVIDCHVIPVTPQIGGSDNIKVGFKTFSPTCNIVTSDYIDHDCGSLNIGEYYANFIDYAPYTRAKLFLPFVGFVDIAPEYFQSGTLSVKYRFNVIDGSFMAFIISTSSKSKLTSSVIAQYGGNACVHIPITGLNYSSMVSGVVGAAAAVASAQPGAGMAAQAVSSAVDVANSKPPLQQSNGYNSTTSFLGVRVPYLLIERSVSNFSFNYADEKGIPSNISRSFSTLKGYTVARDVHLDGIPGATSEDLAAIKELLAEGVIF